jgi:hypothetical protein
VDETASMEAAPEEKETYKPHIASKLEIQSTLDTSMQKILSCILDHPSFYPYGAPFDFASALNYRSTCVDL